MLRTRVMPCLTVLDGKLVKTVNFSEPNYIGDPINAVRIFNEKEVDELVLLDIGASAQNKEPDYDLIADIVTEAFMPVSYGGGIRSLAEGQKLIGVGLEKIIVNTHALQNLDLVTELSEQIGSSSTVVAVDITRSASGAYTIHQSASDDKTTLQPIDHIQNAVGAGAGEIFINDVTRDGLCEGYDLELIRSVAESVDVPVVACGGAGKLEHFKEAVVAGASAVAAGSMFVYVGRQRAVMINYPKYNKLLELFSSDDT